MLNPERHGPRNLTGARGNEGGTDAQKHIQKSWALVDCVFSDADAAETATWKLNVFI